LNAPTVYIKVNFQLTDLLKQWGVDVLEWKEAESEHSSLPCLIPVPNDGGQFLSSSNQILISVANQTGKLRGSYLDPVIDVLFKVNGNPIVITSFLSLNQLQVQDTFGLLRMDGVSYIRLPFTASEFNQIISESKQQNKAELERIQITILETKLMQEFDRMKHLFVSRITGPIRAWCTMPSRTDLLKIRAALKEQAVHLEVFSSQHLTEIRSLVLLKPELESPLLRRAKCFVEIVTDLLHTLQSKECDIEVIVSKVDLLNKQLS